MHQSVYSNNPLYELACKLNDLEYVIAKHLNLDDDSVGRQMMDELISIKTMVDELNTSLLDVAPHLEEIHGMYYASEQRDFEAQHDESGQRPQEHIFYSLEQLNDFMKERHLNV